MKDWIRGAGRCNTNVVGRVGSEQEVKELCEDLGRIFEWSECRSMKGNVG